MPVYALSVIADRTDPGALPEIPEIKDVLQQAALKIQSTKTLPMSGYGCLEILSSSKTTIETTPLRHRLSEIAARENLDIVLQPDSLYRAPKRLLVMDLDSTLIQAEVIDELAREMGVYADVAAVTERAMRGELDFDQSLTNRVAKLKGMRESDIEKVLARIELMPGARELVAAMKARGCKLAVVSGGFTFMAEKVKNELGLDYVRANTLEIQGGQLTGKVVPPIVNAQKKAAFLEEIARNESIPPDQTVAIGDGANDLLMLEKAGLGIAFNAKPVVRSKADASINRKDLSRALCLFG